MSQFGQIMDHTVELQQRVDALEHEMLVYYLTLLGLSFVVGFLTFHVWKASQ